MIIKEFDQAAIRMEYCVFGEGERVLYAFHGFAKKMDDWLIHKSWISSFKVYAFNDLFHGKSTFRDPDLELTPEEHAQFFEAFASAHGHSRVSLLAFSSGGRPLINLLNHSRLEIEEIFLLAVDGITPSFWNDAFCRYAFVRRTYKYLIRKPEALLSTARFLAKARLIDKSLAVFVNYSMHNEEKRRLIYDYWKAYRKIRSKASKSLVSIKAAEIPVYIFVGMEDKVISGDDMRRFADRSDLIQYFELDAGHHLMTKKVAMEIKEILEK